MRAIPPHTILLFLVATLCVVLALTPTSRAGSEAVAATAAEPESVSLDALFEDPYVHLGRAFRFTLQVQSRPESWNPWLSRFGPSEFFAVQVWSDEQWLWDPEDFENPRGMVFVRRGSEEHAALEVAPDYARFEVVAQVRQVFLGQPWIEVVSAQVLPQRVTEGTLIHASRGYTLYSNGRWNIAAAELARARAGHLPHHVDAELARLEQHCHERADAR